MIQYLVGNKSELNKILKPFSKEVISFLDDFSKLISSTKKLNIYPDIKALGFFCRKKNILNFKKKYFNFKRIRFGQGLIFHYSFKCSNKFYVFLNFWSNLRKCKYS